MRNFLHRWLNIIIGLTIVALSLLTFLAIKLTEPPEIYSTFVPVPLRLGSPSTGSHVLKETASLPLPDTGYRIVNITISNDGSWVAVLYQSGQVLIFDKATHRQISNSINVNLSEDFKSSYYLDFKKDSIKIAFSPDKKYLVKYGVQNRQNSYDAEIFEVATGKLYTTVKSNDSSQLIAFSPSSKLLAIRTNALKLTLIKLGGPTASTPQVISPPITNFEDSLRMFSDFKFIDEDRLGILVTHCDVQGLDCPPDFKWRILNITSGKYEFLHDLSREILATTNKIITSDGRFIVLSTQNSITRLNPASNEILSRVNISYRDSYPSYYGDYIFSLDGQLLVVGSWTTDVVSGIQIFNTETGRKLADYDFREMITKVQFVPGKPQLMGLASSRTIRFWDLVAPNSKN